MGKKRVLFQASKGVAPAVVSATRRLTLETSLCDNHWMLYICSKYRPFSNRCSVASSFGLFPVVVIGDEMRCVHEAEVTLTEVSKSSISSGNQQSDFVVLLSTFRQLPTLESSESTAHLRQPSIIMHTKLWVSRTMYLLLLLPDSERFCNKKRCEIPTDACFCPINCSAWP